MIPVDRIGHARSHPPRFFLLAHTLEFDFPRGRVMQRVTMSSLGNRTTSVRRRIDVLPRQVLRLFVRSTGC